METDATPRVYPLKGSVRLAPVVREVRRILFALLCATSLALLPGDAAVPREAATAPQVRAVFAIEEDMFPAAWLAPPHLASARPLVEREQSRSQRVVRAAMAKYPDGFLSRHIDRVYVVGELRFDAIEAAGTNSVDRVYIANGGEEAGFSDRFIEETFHHELSSVLLRRYHDRFDAGAWRAAVPEHVRYGESGVDAVKAGEASLTFEDRLHRDGFIHEYAMATLEDDFNSIAENLFSSQPDFWRIVDEHDAVARKVGLVVEFYRDLDPIFTEEYFRGLGAPKSTGPVDL